MLVAASTSTMAATYTFYHESGYDDANMPIYLIRGADPLINRFFGEINDLCDDQDFRAHDDFQRLRSYCESDIFDELDDLCEGREFELDVDDSLREANKDNNVFDKKGN